MQLDKVSGNGNCGKDDCPTVYRTDRGTVAVQGYTITDADNVEPAANEALVEIPLRVFLEAARAIDG
ncbi:hypothetical protein [Embleya sp. AB8]|uniref:hypothetical protein n=1 Tax=Embleya sp. AB8 TaxID=3156304 RepID=UPI003C76718B